MLKTLKMTVPDEFVETAGSSRAAAARMKQLYVLDLVARKRVSRPKGAALLGLHILDFAKLMDEYHLPFYDADEAADLDAQLASALSATR